MEKIHNHKLKHNKEKDFVFCEECGERWVKENKSNWIVPQYIPTTQQPNLTYFNSDDINYCVTTKLL